MEATNNDLIVISTNIDNSNVRRILINDGSVVEILSYDVYHKLRLNDKDRKFAKPIYGFNNNSIHLREGVILPITMGQGSYTLTFFTNFVVVDQPIAYNTIFSRPMMKATQIVTIVYWSKST